MMPHEVAEGDALWALEEAYWDYLRAGDLQTWSTLWHKDVIAWPLGRAWPVNKAGVVELMTGILAAFQIDRTTLEIHRRSVQVQGDMGITYYDLYVTGWTRDGQQVEDRQRLTHTWVRTEAGWQILGGMSAPLSPE